MDRFFDNNNPVMQFLGRIVDLAIVNLMTIACMIPVVTAGAALSAMNNVLIHLFRKDETYVWKMYIRSFRQNLKQGMALGLLYLGVGILIVVELLMLRGLDSPAATVMMIVLTVLGICIYVTGVYAFALQSRYENTVKGTLKNAAGLALSHPGRSLGMVAIWAAWAVLLWYIHGIALLVFVIYGLSLPAFLCTMIYDPIFQKMEADNEQET